MNNYQNLKYNNIFYRIYCRSFQFIMKIANYFISYRTPEYIEGAGCIKQLSVQIKSKGISKVLLVTGPRITKMGLIDGLINALNKEKILYEIFNNIQANPTDENVEEGYRIFIDKHCEGIIAFGGGSPIDCAKAIAAKNVRPNKKVSQLQGLLKVRKKICPFWAVPTTSGTGSETTIAAVITENKTHHKASINDPAILPKYAVLDPELTKDLPPSITATSGMDALCHAVEAYTNHTYNTKIENDYAKKAVRLIYDYLYRAYQDGNDMEARQKMQLAAFYAGRAFTRGCVGYVHAVGHTLGGLYGLSHGETMAIILPHVMRQYGPSVYKRLSELADVCNINGSSKKEKTENFILWIEELNNKMGIPKGLDCIKDEDIPQIIEWADKESNPLYPVPVIWGSYDFVRLIQTLRS